MEGAQEGTARLFSSIVNIGEVYYRIGKTRNQKDAIPLTGDPELLNLKRMVKIEKLRR